MILLKKGGYPLWKYGSTVFGKSEVKSIIYKNGPKVCSIILLISA